jgi:nuclease-like protein
VTDDQPDLADATPPAVRRRAGQHARATQRLFAHRAIVKIGAAFAPLILAIALLGFGWATCAIEVPIVFYIVFIDRTASELVDRWGRGAAGEELVGEALDGLREHGWFALHDVELGGGNIDHVLVGPAGIFTIETKSHRGRLRSGAIDARLLKQAYAQAKLVERITALRAVPLLVFSSAYLIPAVTRRDGVVILPSRMLVNYLHKRGGTIPPERVDDVYRRLAAALPG